jgi:hypothetical protein
MKTEKVVISFVAALLGLIVAFVAFYFYQSSKVLPKSQTTIASKNSTTKIRPTPTPDKTFFLTLESPANESVTTNKSIEVTGRTSPNATIVALTPTDQQVVTPSQSGTYSISTTIGDGANVIEITAIAPNGEEKSVSATVTYSTEDF